MLESQPVSLMAGLVSLVLISGSAIAQSAPGPTPALDAAVVGATVGRDVARRWCAGEEPRRAIERTMVAYLSGLKIPPDQLPQATTQALGKEIAVEAFAQAFASCPQTARQVFRTMMQ